MAAALGGLVVSLTADTVSFQDSLTRAAYTTSQTMGQIASSLDSVVGRFQLLQHAVEAVVFSEIARGAADFVSSMVQTQAHLQDLGVSVGTTAAQMSALIPAATLSGTSLDDVGMATERLERSLSPMSKNAKAAQDALGALGFSAQDAKRFLADPAEGLLEISQRLNTFADDGNKTAVVMALMGRNAGEILPYLKQLGEQTSLNSTVTNEQAAAAHALVTEWNELKLRGEELRNEIASGIVPAMSMVLDEFIAGTGQAGEFGQTIRQWASDGTFATWLVEAARDAAVVGESFSMLGALAMTLGNDIRLLVQDVVILVDAYVALGRTAADPTLSKSSTNDAINSLRTAIDDRKGILDDYAKYQKQWADAESGQLSAALQRDVDAIRIKNDFMRSMTAEQRAFEQQMEGTSLVDVPQSPKGHLDVSQAGKVDNTFQTVMKALEAEAAKARLALAQAFDPAPMTEAAKALVLFVQSPEWSKLTSNQQTQYLQRSALVQVTQGETLSYQALLAMYKQIDDENAKSLDVTNQVIASAQQQVDQLNEQAATMGMSAAALDDYHAAQLAVQIAREQDVVLVELQQNGTDAEIENEQRKIAALIAEQDAWNNLGTTQRANDASKAMADAAKQAEQAWKQAASSISNDLITAFDDWVHGAKNLGQQLRDELLKMFDTLILRPILQPIAGGIAGLAFPGVAGASGGGVGGTLSSFSSSLANLLTPGGISGLGGSFFGGVGSSLANIGDAGLFAGISGDFSAGLTALGAGNIAGGLGSLIGGALPIVGPIAAIAALFGSGLFGAQHGPKTGGFGETGSDYGRFYTPNQDDTSLMTLATTTLTSYNTLLSSLGGTGSANFAFGYDEDPKGTADSRVSAGATVNGQRIFDILNQDAGRGDKGVKTDLQLDAERALLAALQASNLPKDIANILDSITPSSASLDQIKQLEQIATAYGDLSKDLAANSLSDALEAVRKQSEGAYGAFQDQITAYKSLLSTYDGSTAATTALDKASQGLYASLVSVLAQVQEVKASLDTMFGDTIRKFQIDSLDKQGQYGFYQTEVSSLMKQISTAADPDSVKQLETLVNQDLQAAFGLLDPSQKAGLLNQYIAAANAADAAGNIRLTALGANATTQFSAAATQAQQALTDAANKMHDAAATIAAAATTQATAATTALQAAQTPVTLNVNVNGTTAAEVNIG